MNETVRDAAQAAADDKAYARLAAVKNDIARLSQQISEAVNALGAVAQGQARRGLRNARANVDSAMSDASDGKRYRERCRGCRVFGRRSAGRRDRGAARRHAGFCVWARLSDRRDLAPIVWPRSSCPNGSPIACRSVDCHSDGDVELPLRSFFRHRAATIWLGLHLPRGGRRVPRAEHGAARGIRDLCRPPPRGSPSSLSSGAAALSALADPQVLLVGLQTCQAIGVKRREQAALNARIISVGKGRGSS